MYNTLKARGVRSVEAEAHVSTYIKRIYTLQGYITAIIGNLPLERIRVGWEVNMSCLNFTLGTICDFPLFYIQYGI